MSIPTPQRLYIKSSASGSTSNCFEAEYLNSTLVLIRDSKLNWQNWLTKKGVRVLSVKDYCSLLAGLKDGEFDYEQNHENYNGSGISLVKNSRRFKGRKDCPGISMYHPSWKRGSLWFSQSEWNALQKGVMNGELTLAKLLEDKNNKTGWRGFMRRIRSTVQLAN